MAFNDSLDEVAKRKFADSMFELASQIVARSRRAVEVVPVEGEEVMLDRYADTEVQELIGRHPEIIPQDLKFDRRKLYTSRVGVPFFIDEWDKLKVGGDLEPALARRAMQAIEKHFDRVVLRAALGSVFTGKHGTTAISGATDGVATFDATAGLTYDKLVDLDALFQKYDVGTDIPVEKYLFISEQEHAQLMKETKLTSGDFTHQYVIERGEITRALTFNIIKYGSGAKIPMLDVVTTTRKCIALAVGGVKVGMSQSTKVVKEKVNNRWFTEQMLASLNIGALRMEGRRIIQVNTTAS